MKNDLGAIILAAGKGSRMKAKKVNKVAMHLANKPMILHTVELLKSLNVNNIIVTVGFAKRSVMDLLDGEVIFADQKKRLGTAHAVSIALEKINKEVKDVIVLNGDDSAFYSKKIISDLIQKHRNDKSKFTFLTIEKDNPFGLGRVVRDTKGEVTAVVEEKDATKAQRKIKEVNPGCYIFSVDFLKKYISKVEKSDITNEYYLTSLIGIGIKNQEKIETVRAGRLIWRGVNTKEELSEAEKLLLGLRKK
ncbi:MAG TPA: sugar phosphate nucleotidyltransferase [Candidatus Sulfotelmatobacter sp.]|nr:sugar phosphate nucleotidyltransferase [Candidatus Sulfotelmatobacter sp.]